MKGRGSTSSGQRSARVGIYPIFLPHAGCPFQCVYCNQRVVSSSGGDDAFGRESDAAGRGMDAAFLSFEEQLAGILEHAVRPYHAKPADEATEEPKKDISPGEIAFYGGTFTAIPDPILRRILDTVTPLVERGVFGGIRFSTRPDRVTPEVCVLLADYPVRTVELGVQSLSDDVLAESRRGYSSATVHGAAALVRENGWQLGIQLMAGLPGDTRDRFLGSIFRTIAMKPDLVRIYPTLVLRDTPLAGLFLGGGYTPLGLDEALEWCASAYDAFLRADIPIARMGLHSDRELEKPGNILAGPHHPAFGYLVRVRWWRDRVDEYLQDLQDPGEHIALSVPARSVSEVLGPGRCNVSHWQEEWGIRSLQVIADHEMAPHQFASIRMGSEESISLTFPETSR